MTDHSGKKISMKQVAVQAEVDPSTVSLALRNDPRLPLSTRRRIQALAKRMGYRRDAVLELCMAQVRGNRTRRTPATLGFVNLSADASLLDHEYTFRSFFEGAGNRALALGYDMQKFWLQEPGLTPAKLSRRLDALKIEGVVLAGLGEKRIFERFHSGIWNRKALAFAGNPSPRGSFHYASCDHFQITSLAYRKLRELNYDRIGLYAIDFLEMAQEYRTTGAFLTAQQLFGGTAIPPLLSAWGFGNEDLEAWVRRFRPDAILTRSDLRVRLETMGLHVPRDIALAHLVWGPPHQGLAGVDQKSRNSGAAAVDLVVAQLHQNVRGNPPFAKNVLSGGTWVNGASAPPKKKRVA